ncbi:hypothetical protein ARAF_2325 [Arsenophonus endosymbiont of Aleurodicus floccissimus]|uniref:hypothetical protein n=1 Tax=Arsenophonus endosymbiont of Aleurodicus floccissimus TaxID=2152761 RepID=UPI000E6B249F|nr:hypothetical protein [Arsenophonus endosymbiont of Aleurodicus floccissimus]SPP32284.1 hypothetical protein ARAF_2325 [Arsenophonus endosymbiont of Aleurodicus floccissimus]
MILTVSKQALLSAMIFQAKCDERYYLNGICFAPKKKLYSTDGHRAFLGEHESEDLKENVIVGIKGPKFVKFDKAKIDTELGMVTYLDCFGIRVGVATCEVINGKYPDISRIMPKENKPVSEIGFNASYLADIEKVAKIYNPKYKLIKIKPNGNDSVVIIKLNKNTSVIVMPTRI